MTYKTLLNAYPALKAFTALRLGIVNAVRLADLLDRVNRLVSVYMAEENKLILKYAILENGEPMLENGNPRFENEELKSEYIRERNILLNAETEPLPKLIIDERTISDEQTITADELVGLSVFAEIGGDTP